MVVLGSAAFGGGCGGDSAGSPSPAVKAPFDVAITSSDLAVGRQRFAFVALQNDNPINNETMYLRFFKAPVNGNPTLVGEGPIPWSPLSVQPAAAHKASGHLDTEITGVYYANIAFDEAGNWGLGVSRGDKLDLPNEVRVSFTVRATTQAPAIGARAVPVKNPTSGDLPIKQIDTSPIPDPAFHELSISDAITSGKPSVIAFATPSFCVSRTCGPAMEVVTEVWKAAPGQFNVVHVEPYKLSPGGELLVDSNNQRVNSEAGNLWRLPSEPWVFVIDAKGVVVARFDGPFALDELTSALAEAGVRG